MNCPKCMVELSKEQILPEGVRYVGGALKLYKYTCPICGYVINLGE